MDRGSGITVHGKGSKKGSRAGLYWGLSGAALAAVLGVGIYFWQTQTTSPPPIGGGASTVQRSVPQSVRPLNPEIVSPETGTRQPETVFPQESTLIESIQDYLNRLGYQVPRSGELDARTTAGIRVFEESRGLLVTGEVDEILQAALVEAYREKDDAAWQQARASDTEQAYLAYAEAHPRGHAIEKLPTRIAAVRERLAAEQRRLEQEAAAAARQHLGPEQSRSEDDAAATERRLYRWRTRPPAS